MSFEQECYTSHLSKNVDLWCTLIITRLIAIIFVRFHMSFEQECYISHLSKNVDLWFTLIISWLIAIMFVRFHISFDRANCFVFMLLHIVCE